MFFSSSMNRRRTLILSKADGEESPVLSPNNTTPWPGNETIGLTLAVYNLSLSDCLGEYASLVAFLKLPLLYPAGENQVSEFIVELMHSPATSAAHGT